MEGKKSAGLKFRAALEAERPLQIAGTINAYAAILAKSAGFHAIYLSGAGVSNASYGLPDLGFTSLRDVLEDVRRITGAVDLPLLVDVDTGWDDPAATVRQMIDAGAAAVHLEDQVEAKRCGHRPNKQLVSVEEMCARIESAVSGRTDPDFQIMARTDAFDVEGLAAAVARARRYRAAGADLIFAEAIRNLDQYRQFAKETGLPILANITEFGKTPLFTTAELAGAGVRMALYPLSAFRAMNAAALAVYRALREHGTQKDLLDRMQTRAELYEFLDYHKFEAEIDEQAPR